MAEAIQQPVVPSQDILKGLINQAVVDGFLNFQEATEYKKQLAGKTLLLIDAGLDDGGLYFLSVADVATLAQNHGGRQIQVLNGSDFPDLANESLLTLGRIKTLLSASETDLEPAKAYCHFLSTQVLIHAPQFAKVETAPVLPEQVALKSQTTETVKPIETPKNDAHLEGGSQAVAENPAKAEIKNQKKQEQTPELSELQNIKAQLDNGKGELKIEKDGGVIFTDENGEDHELSQETVEALAEEYGEDQVFWVEKPDGGLAQLSLQEILRLGFESQQTVDERKASELRKQQVTTSEDFQKALREEPKPVPAGTAQTDLEFKVQRPIPDLRPNLSAVVAALGALPPSIALEPEKREESNDIPELQRMKKTFPNKGKVQLPVQKGAAQSPHQVGMEPQGDLAPELDSNGEQNENEGEEAETTEAYNREKAKRAVAQKQAEEEREAALRRQKGPKRYREQPPQRKTSTGFSTKSAAKAVATAGAVTSGTAGAIATGALLLEDTSESQEAITFLWKHLDILHTFTHFFT